MSNQVLHKCRPTTAKLSRPQIMDPSWSLNIDMTEIKLSTLEEVETLLTKPRRTNKKRAEDILIKKTRRIVPGPIDAKRPAKVTAMDILSEEVIGQVPSPCKTCTKNDEPERFHSHPKTATRSRTIEEGTPRKTVSKPVALKYKSGKSKDKSKIQVEIKEATQIVPTTKPIPAKLNVRKVSKPCSKCGKQVITNLLEAHERICRGKIDTVVLAPVNLKAAYDQALLFCRKCGKTFGTDEEMLRNHIETCDVKWTDLDGQLENEPSVSLTDNEGQYEEYKETLMPCPICKRKFMPNRIETHESACRKLHHK